MMEKSKQSPDMHFLEETRLIARWTRRYAHSRTVPIFVFLGFFMAYWFSVVGLTKAGVWALQNQHPIVFWLCVAATVPLIVLLLWFSFPSKGSRWLERLGWRYYEREGSVTLPESGPRNRKMAKGIVAAVLFAAALLTHINLGIAGYTPIEYGQPISALYVVPFTVFLALSDRNYIKLLMPLLYGLHAILLLCGVPLRFWSDPAQDMPYTVVGYMLLTALIGHAYNRYALARLKRVARASGAEEVD